MTQTQRKNIFLIISLCIFTIWIGAWTGYYFFTPGPWYNHPENIIQAQTNWDAGWYMNIAKNGYHYDSHLKAQQNVAFFPLYPIIVKVLSLGLGFRNGLATIAPALIFGVISIYLFFNLAKFKLKESAAFFATAAYSLYPGAAFFVSAYPTSLMNLLVIIAILSYLKKRYKCSAITAGLGTAAGPLLVFLSIALFIQFSCDILKNNSNSKMMKFSKIITFGLVSISGILGYTLYQYIMFQEPFAFIHIQSAWGTETITHRLWNIITLYPIFGGGYGEFLRSLIFLQPVIKNPQTSIEDVFNTLSIIMAIFSTWVFLKSKDYMLFFYSLFVVAGYIWFIGSIQGTISTFRLLYIDIPIFIAAGIFYQQSNKKILKHVMLPLSGIALFLQAAFFVSGYWAF